MTPPVWARTPYEAIARPSGFDGRNGRLKKPRRASRVQAIDIVTKSATIMPAKTAVRPPMPLSTMMP